MWKSFLTKNQINSAPEKLALIVKKINDFLTSPVKSILNNKEFDYHWNSPGHWKA